MHRNRIRWISDDRPKDQYAALPNELIRDTTISWAAKGIAGYFWSHRDGYEVSANGIAAEFGTAPKTVGKYLAELEVARWLAINKEVRNAPEYYLHPGRRLTEDEYQKCIGTKSLKQNLPKGIDEMPQGYGQNVHIENLETAGPLGHNVATKNKENQREDQRENQGVLPETQTKSDAATKNSGAVLCGCHDLPFGCPNDPTPVRMWNQYATTDDTPPPF